MKLSELWLREWVNPALTREQLCAKLTMSGLEIESVTPVADVFSGVVVGHVLNVEKHPEADRLQVCTVDVGSAKPLTIVCGAKNVVPGMKAPAALEGAVLANKIKIKRSKLRGVESEGMLCSAVELGLSEQGEGLLELPKEALLGQPIWEYLKLTDHVIDVSITPNRGDCLSVMGLAKDISALTETPLTIPSITPVKPAIKDSLTVKVHAPADCPRYAGRIIRGVKADAETPMWMREHLRRSGQRCISPVVDVMNYVMFELGQPMHAFDLQTIADEIIVRKAHANEEIKLLDGQTAKLKEDTLVIADKEKALAMAGIMGGLDSSVTLLTQDIFLESAFFSPTTILRVARRYGLGSESSYRFERGIDPTLQVQALERATQLLLEIVGGQPGPIVEVCDTKTLPQPANINLRKARISKILGFTFEDKEIEHLLRRLDFIVQTTSDGWQVTTPARRSDIKLEVDLIEEIIRVHGYEKIPSLPTSANLKINPRPENTLNVSTLRRALCDAGFNEVITYSFIDKKQQKLFDPEHSPKELVNPITADMTVMRTNLWPGLVTTLLYNQNRQQSRAKFFETGLRYLVNGSDLIQQRVISGLISGHAYPEQWGIPNREVDFFDLKGNLQKLFNFTFDQDEFNFKTSSHPALHPGQTAEILRNNKPIGIMGALHPSIIQALDIQGNVFVFEITLDSLEKARIPRAHEISKFPENRRDIAILVDRTVPAQLIQDTIRETAGELLQDVHIFDVYQGKGIDPKRKSIALALTLQHATRTLRDEEITDLVERVIGALQGKFTAELRG